MELTHETRTKAFHERVRVRQEIAELRKHFNDVNARLLELYRAEQLLHDNPNEYFNQKENETLPTH